MKCFAKKIALASVLLLSLSGGAWAVPYVGATGLAASQTIDFTPAVTPSQTAVTTQYAGVTFSNFFSSPYLGNFSPGDTDYIGNHPSNDNIDFFPTGAITSSITFASSVTSASFAMNNFSNVTLTALLGVTVVDSFVANVQTGGGFFGFHGITFDSIRLDSAVSGNGSDLYIDNLGFGTPSSVPEIDASSASLPLVMCIGLMLGLSDRRRKAEVLA